MQEKSIFQGQNVVEYSASDPLLLFIVQAILIIGLSRILHFPLSYLQQPRVIAEVIGGILLGPTAFGRIPGFLSHIFPDESMGPLNLVSNLGLVLFLFVIGMEVDTSVFVSNFKATALITLSSIVFPFAAGSAISVGMHQFTPNSNFGEFLLFIGTAMSITAFPVLARILSELHLLHRRLGVIVLAAGVGNDVVGWILLALSITLVNSGTGVQAIYVLLLVCGWCVFLFLLVRPLLRYLAIKTRSLEKDPSELFICIILCFVLISAFFTDIIGVHPIFGGFLMGTIIPHDNDLTIKITEKIEDLVVCLLLPLYFASSGLKTNMATLNDGKAWAYTIAVILIAISSKILSSALTARCLKMAWSESWAIGSLMSCKGLVELIVLNIGLSSGILEEKIFSMFVVMAVVTTFVTTPMTKFCLRFLHSGSEQTVANRRGSFSESCFSSYIYKICILFHQPSAASAAMIFTNYLGESYNRKSPLLSMPVIEMQGISTTYLESRTSALLKASQLSHKFSKENTLEMFKIFVRINGLRFSEDHIFVDDMDFADVILEKLKLKETQLLIVPILKEIDIESSSKPTSQFPSSIEKAFGSFGQFLRFLKAIKRGNAPFSMFLTQRNSEVHTVHHQGKYSWDGSVVPCDNESLESIKMSEKVDAIERVTELNQDSECGKKTLIFIFTGTANDMLALDIFLTLLHDSESTAIIYLFEEYQVPLSDIKRPEAAYSFEQIFSDENNQKKGTFIPRLRKKMKMQEKQPSNASRNSSSLPQLRSFSIFEAKLEKVHPSIRSRIRFIRFSSEDQLVFGIQELFRGSNMLLGNQRAQSLMILAGCEDAPDSQLGETGDESFFSRNKEGEVISNYEHIFGYYVSRLLLEFPLTDFFLAMNSR
ncbi:potassium ion/proton antiporter [Schizosaccharomyces cryophilus OY26]|uniref:Potassium ion/proton antiporter n=1 Tax=Schizosaccharomyces cryophilus (strain OY26 / ATCC MYA-4695 / CBS 11777 / NBRC 106824 / NRRL Y48691) TaxID=653667 RepID=S9X8J2_SCHCR|nr:potassium ion/proton antiporter [Schizosaccharomyces cryophilus OY26]EPY53452.1 potassium ion/proton antiporter [Schizosaccharomyces cryophilus OY26]